MGIICNKDTKESNRSRMLLASIALERKMDMFQDFIEKSRNSINPDLLENELSNISLLYNKFNDISNTYLEELR